MTELARLVTRLERGVSRQASYLKTIKHPQGLISSLRELNDLIGNDKVKDSVAVQISHLIMVKRRAMDNTCCVREDDVMLNTVLYGPPGTGKTLVGTKLAKIWYSLGYLDNNNNIKAKKHEFGDVIKDMLRDNGVSSNTTENETALTIYIMVVFVTIFITLIAMTWSFYNKFGGPMTMVIITTILIVIMGVGYYVKNMWETSGVDAAGIIGKDSNINATCDGSVCQGTKKDEAQDPLNGNIPIKAAYFPPDDQMVKVVTRGDFVDKYVGWTSQKTNKLLEDNLGKVLFVDEAYSLVQGPHDEFGMEALTALNLFLSQRPKEIIVIFAGYKDLLESGPYSVQPGLKRRFMWQFNCNGYTADQLFEIYKMQLAKKGWGLTDEARTKDIFKSNADAFPAFGGDTERAGFFAELEHSRDFIANEKDMKISMLEPRHVRRGIEKLRENNFDDTEEESTNPMANIMRLMSGKNKNNNKKPKEPREIKPVYDEFDDNLIADVRKHATELAFR